jgi:hypothetical protein
MQKSVPFLLIVLTALVGAQLGYTVHRDRAAARKAAEQAEADRAMYLKLKSEIEQKARSSLDALGARMDRAIETGRSLEPYEQDLRHITGNRDAEIRALKHRYNQKE